MRTCIFCYAEKKFFLKSSQKSPKKLREKFLLAIIPSGLPRELKNEKEISRAIKNNCKTVLNLIAQKKLIPKNLISGIYHYKYIEKAYKKLLKKDRESITYILKWPV